MEIKLFGSVCVMDGRDRRGPSDFGGVKPKQVLELLLLARGRAVSKDALVDGLWPHQTPKNALATLETYISVLRRNLCTDRRLSRRIVVTSPGAYRIATDLVSTDLDRFDELWSAAQEPGAARRQLLAEALELADGELLEDEPYAEWVQDERRRYRDRVAMGHVLVSADALADGDAVGAIRHGELSLRMDPTTEEAWRLVARGHHALGHGSAAKRVLDRCTAVLAAELGVSPSPDTIEACAAPAPPTTAGSTAGRRAAVTTPRLGAPTDRRLNVADLPLLGREAPLGIVEALSVTARGGTFTTVAVDGCAGMGRTALLAKLAGLLPGAVGRHRYVPHDASFPGAALSEAVLDAASQVPGSAAALTELWDLPGEGVDTLADVLRSNGPTTLLLDDVQWAHPSTIDAIAALAHRHPELPVLVVAACRSDLREGEDVLARLEADASIQLGPITEADLTTWTCDLELLRLSGGTPGLLADLLRWSQSGRVGLPPSLVASVKHQVSTLPPELRMQLQVAAALPEPFDTLDLALLLEGSVADVRAQLLTLTQRGFYVPFDGGSRFREPVVRRVLADTMSAARRAALVHRAIGRVPRPLVLVPEQRQLRPVGRPLVGAGRTGAPGLGPTPSDTSSIDAA